jgi:oligopeptide/dipeptide ABC transporter ATP-binding protein
MSEFLVADDLTRGFPARRGIGELLRGGPRPMVRALNGVSLQIARGETLAVVGESGCGKSTLARALVRLIELDGGQITFDGMDVRSLTGAALRRYNRRVQMVFQDPHGSLNPRMTVGQILEEALHVHEMVPAAQRPARIVELLSLVRLPADAAGRLPHEFSGGQRQRIAIARALSIEPELLIADEIVSALDVSVQAQILNLLLDLQDRLGLSYLFIAHDLAVVRAVSTRIAVMYAGAIVETAPKAQLYSDPQHPYARALLNAVPRADPDFVRHPVVAGEVPSLLDPSPGCAFHPRCAFAMARCRVELPLLKESGAHRRVACHLFST